ncbi:hypothetical protein [Streptobacillus moniliformis]|uniref:hypothetical protein n=1 Tax=Streptobacillus moniliformis TaxID=34105 RepID=UPI0007E38F85|nr:hypothetical protein [Streptobacillus moniliformis]
MIFTISTEDIHINYNPLNEIEDVLRNVSMILRICKEEQPLQRNFSFDSDLIDKNIDVVKNKLSSHLLEQFKKYEPRALLKGSEIKLKENNNFDISIGIEVII